MKRFSENINENQKHYSNDLKLYNEIYDLINEHLNPKMDGKDSDKINIVGKEDLVKELSKIVDNQVIKEKINFFKKIEKNPKLILEAKTSKDFAEELKEDFKKVAQTIYSCKTDDQCDTAKKMVDNLKNKYHKKMDQMGSYSSSKLYGDYNQRIKELNNAIKDKRIEIKYEIYKKSKERDGKSFWDIEKWKKENNMNEAWGMGSLINDENTVWLTVDHSEPVTFEEFYSINTEDDVDSLSPEEFEQIKNMKIGDVLTFGMCVDVERVESPYKIDENFNSENQKADLDIITNYVKELSAEIKITNDNAKMSIKLNDLKLDIDIKPSNIKVLKNNKEKFNFSNIKELKDFIKTEIEKIK